MAILKRLARAQWGEIGRISPHEKKEKNSAAAKPRSGVKTVSVKTASRTKSARVSDEPWQLRSEKHTAMAIPKCVAV
jgi:hypothetical protein